MASFYHASCLVWWWVMLSGVLPEVEGQNTTAPTSLVPNTTAPTLVPNTTAPTLFVANTTTPTISPNTTVPTLAPTLFVAPDCFTSTRTIFQAMLRANSTENNTYVICPNTIIDVGEPDANNNCCIEGDFFLFLRSRSTVMCGEDGKSSNNCVLRGGNTHVFFPGGVFGDDISQDVQVMGLTFEDADFLSVALAARGDVTFTDCIWRNHTRASGVVFVAHTPSQGDRRKLLVEESESDQGDPFAVASYMMTRNFLETWTTQTLKDASATVLHDGRYLQALSTMEVTFEDCLFVDNAQGPTTAAGIPLFGIVAILTPFNPTVLRNTRFEGNRYDGSDGSQNGYAIQSTGSPLELHDCCFQGNSFIGFGPVQAFAGAPLEYSYIYASADDLIICDFAAVSEDFVPESFDDVECVNADLLTCGGTFQPSTSPTEFPSVSMAPSLEPSAVPTPFPSLSLVPSEDPTNNPTGAPTLSPSLSPTVESTTAFPTVLTATPSAAPDSAPSGSSSVNELITLVRVMAIMGLIGCII